MDKKHIFISHASADDDFVKALRMKLELHGLNVWVDSRKLRGGDRLQSEIEKAIKTARQVIAVLSPKTINSAWVRKEIQLAEQIGKEQEDYRVIPLMLPGIEPPALLLWFKEEPTGIKIQMETGQLQEKLPEIFAALGERLPDDIEPPKEVTANPLTELLLELSRPELTHEDDGSFQLSSEAQLEYIPVDSTQPRVKSKRFKFISPIGQIEQNDLRWYLEKYYLWPAGLFQKRAKEIEAHLPKWGQALFDKVLDKNACREAVEGWKQAKTTHDRRFSVRIDAELLEGSPQIEQNNALEAASKLMSLPWELLHDGKNYLSDGAYPVRLRRRLPNYENRAPLATQLPIRILLFSPRPEEEGVGYIDHRASAKPLAEAVESLGELVELSILTPATFGALQQELQRAQAAEQPYHVLHFDGHGVYDRKHGLGALCFEDPKDSHKLQQRAMQLIYAKYQEGNPDTQNNLAGLITDYRIPLVFLEACQTAQNEADPNTSVAASLLEEGVASVIAMSHSVLVKTASLFVTAFYSALAQGQRVGQAMLAGQQALKQNSYRFPILGAGELHLQDWFVPILYQEKHDPQLFDRIPSSKAEKLRQQQQQARLGFLPETPTHTFIGRSRELLLLERLLEQQSYAVIRGMGGMGKTTLAVELACWLVRSRRFDRCAFVSLEEYSHDRAVLDVLGRQLVGQHYTVAEYGDDLKQALQPIQRVLENEACLLLLDNMESLLTDSENIQPVLSLAQTLLQSDSKTRVLLTSREHLPQPFNHGARTVELGELNENDAKALIMSVMAEQNRPLEHDNLGRTPEEVDALVNAVNGHARALVLLARELAIQGVTATTENVRELMQKLEREHPGEREYSLFASLELSLSRLSVEHRELVKGLAVFYDGGSLTAIAYVLDIDTETAKQLCIELVQVGLVEEKEYAYLRFDPALPNYLSLQLKDTEKQQYRLRWAEVMSLLVNFLLQQRFRDIKLAARLTQLTLPNLMAFIRNLNSLMYRKQVEAEIVSSKAGCIEQLLEYLNYPQELAEVVYIRQHTAQWLDEWNAVRFSSEKQNIERLLTQGELQQACEAAQQLLQQSRQAAGKKAYAGVDYDLAMAYSMLGQALYEFGSVREALPYLQQAQQRFEALQEISNRMVSVSLLEVGDCLLAMGQLEQAATIYQKSIHYSEELEDIRQIAIGKGQLAAVCLRKKDYFPALQEYQEALGLYQQLNEPNAIAWMWHHIGMVYVQQKQFANAESAYRQSLSLRVANHYHIDEAISLGELANLYADWNHPEQAVDYYQQAINIYVQRGNQRYEGATRSNLARTLMKLNRLDEARIELLRAVKCKQAFDHTAEPWKTWHILYNLEQAVGNPQAVQAARQKAIQTYYAYRQDGGENHDGSGRLASNVLQAIQQDDLKEIQQIIGYYLKQVNSQGDKTALYRLKAILAGERNPALAEDSEMRYDLVVELKILLEQLQKLGL